MQKGEKNYKKLRKIIMRSFKIKLIVSLLFMLITCFPIIINAQAKNVTISIKDGSIEDVLKEILLLSSFAAKLSLILQKKLPFWYEKLFLK